MKEQIETLSPFELSLYLEKKMPIKGGEPLLNAGRGNPNWTAPIPREAFFLLGQFAAEETKKSDSALVGTQIRPSEDRKERFEQFLVQHDSPAADFLHWVITKASPLIEMDASDWLDQACDAIIGDNYPNPSRCLPVCEYPLRAYMTRELFDERQVPMDIFPTEGGTAGICYLFDTLMNTQLLHKGDKIALFLPTFAPYVEIPELPHYEFDVVKVKAKQIVAEDKTSYIYPAEEIDKLRDPEIKVAFIVNPSNPTANAMGLENISQIESIVQTDRPDLMILTDDVYGTFVPHFLSLFAAMPKNTACLYSFSKYFGATGWRVGAISIAHDNIFDKLIKELPADTKKAVDERYASLAPDPASVKFIDRLVADSRDIALNHAAGLSTVQQIMISLFSLYGLMDEGQAYKAEVVETCHIRERALFTELGLTLPAPARDTAYYCDVDLLNWSKKRYGDEFAEYLEKNWTVTKLLVELYEKEHLILLKTKPFGSDIWCVRVSLANLPTKAYQVVGQRMIHLFDNLYKNFK